MKSRLALPLLTLVALAFVAGSTGRAQQEPQRRGGPLDWSHGHVVATRFGPDGDAGITRDLRTVLKHARRDAAQARRAARLEDLWARLGRRPRGNGPPPVDTAPSSEMKLDWSLQTGGTGAVLGYPAKYSFDITAYSCSDVIYFTVNQAGAANVVNVIAITNAYETCPGNALGTTPTVKFGLRLNTAAPTSAVPSYDGQVLYVFENGTAGVILHALNVNNISGGTYNAGTWSNAHALPAFPSAEELFRLTFSGVTNTVSSPFLDYFNNQIFFGDASGRVHRVINTHLSTASEAPGFPVQCGGTELSSPVFANDQVIVTNANGYVFRIDTRTGPPYACIAAGQQGTGALSSPIVDVTSGTNGVIIVTGNNAFNSRGVGTFPLMFAPGAGYTSAQALGGASATIAPVTPAFDDAFWATNTGHLFAVGAASGGSNAYVIRLPYANGVINVADGYAALHRSGPIRAVPTTPVMEFKTASGADYIYVGGGSNTYLFMNRITTTWAPAGSDGSPTAFPNWYAVTGGVISGMIIDTRESDTTGQAKANIYFGGAGGSLAGSAIYQLAQEF